MKKSCKPILIVVWFCSLVSSFLAGLIFSGIFSVNNIKQYDTAFGNWAMWFGALGTIGTLIFLSSQHIQNIRDKHQEKRDQRKYQQSKIATETFLTTIDTLISVLTNEGMTKDRAFAFFSPTCRTLQRLAPNITEEAHLASAEAKYQELLIHLQIFYFELKSGDIFNIWDEKQRGIEFSINSHSWSGSIYMLVTIWLKHVIPNYGVTNGNVSIYGWGQHFIQEECLLALLALLLSRPQKMIAPEEINEQISAFNNARSNENVITSESRWLLVTLEKYPLLLAHLVLRSISFQAIRTSPKPEIFYPIFTICGPDNAWFVLQLPNHPGITVLKLPDRLAKTKEKYIHKLSSEERLKAGFIHYM
ncbi:hypothetical protein [Vibrio parahaemolyticus]|uniref:hypothetical protein n=1 Tax=Vibrio parahaemolyticus TaxID=670 RepID=UPI0004238D58|nr:hypothetical protein [Vibrio parahaemolyticus]MBE5200195.1 hypothetical protein [Vibrio parahaemolyticus]HAS6503680.1 hypothetical protein [Vibrio parahaemolyticus]